MHVVNNFAMLRLKQLRFECGLVMNKNISLYVFQYHRFEIKKIVKKFNPNYEFESFWFHKWLPLNCQWLPLDCTDLAEMIELNIEPQKIVYYDKLDINRKIPNQHRSTIQVS